MNKLNFLADWLPKRGHCTAARLYKSRETWRETPHRCGFWWDVSFSSQVKKHRSRFWPRLKRKPSEEYVEYFDLLVVNRSFERYSCLEFILKNSKNTAKICRVLFRLTLNACLRQTSWTNIVVVLNVSLNDIISLSWLFVKISFLSLFRLWVSVVHEHRIQEYSKCRMYQMNMEFRSKMQTKMILRLLSTSVHSNSRGDVKRLVYALPAPDL